MMGLTKSEIFSPEQNEIASMAKVLAHPARIAILQILAKAENCICGDLVSEIGLAQPTISQHLKELKNAGFIKGNIEGTSVCYCIDLATWEKVRDRLLHFFDAFQGSGSQSNCC